MTQKIATCSYCGSRAALVLCGEKQHSLACGTCGAPLHDLKALKPQKSSKKKSKQPKVPKEPPHKMDLPYGLPTPSGKYVKKRISRKLQRKLAKKAIGALIDLFD